MLEHRKEEYKNAGVDYYQPWLVIMTDGEPTDDISNVSIRLSELVVAKKISIFPIAIGNTNTDKLAKLSPGRGHH